MPNSVWDAIHKTCDAIRDLPDADAPSAVFTQLDVDRGRYDATAPIRNKLNEVLQFLEPFESVAPEEFPTLPSAIAESLVTELGVIAGVAESVIAKCKRWPETTGVIPPSFSPGEINARARTVDAAYGEIFSHLHSSKDKLPVDMTESSQNQSEKPMETASDTIWEPLSALREAIKAVPAMRYALAVLGSVAVVAIIAAWRIDLSVAIFGTIIVLILMVIILVFAHLVKIAPKYFLLPALVLVWASVLLTLATATSLLTAATIKRPSGLFELIFSRKVTATEPPITAPTAAPSVAVVMKSSPEPTPEKKIVSTAAPTTTPAAVSTVQSTPRSIGESSAAFENATTVIVDQGMIALKAGNWSGAVDLFGKALKVEPGNKQASDALWRALSQQSDAYLPLPDRAYDWPEGAQLVNLAQKLPLALALKKINTNKGEKLFFVVYNYESGNEFQVYEAPSAPFAWATGGFVVDDRYVLITGDKSGPILFEFNNTGAWKGPTFPNGYTSVGGRPSGDFLLQDKNGQFRWWSVSKSAWAEPTVIKIAKLKWLFGNVGHYLIYQDSATDMHIYDLLTQKDVCQPLHWVIGSFDFSGNGQVLALPESNLTDSIKYTLQQLFSLWILPQPDSNAPTFGRSNYSGNFRLEIKKDDKDSQDVYLRQREPSQAFHLVKQSNQVNLRPWHFHPSREELYLQTNRSLCVYSLPTMLYFAADAAPAPPQKPPGTTIARFLQLNRKDTAVKLCRERDDLHNELVADEALPSVGKHFADMPDEWRKMLLWWTAKPAERKPW